jgi:SH3-like domain-containing protein
VEGISLRASPSQQGKWLSSISLGEKVVYLGATAVDSADNNREYCKVRLSDGKEGWAFAWPIISNAKAAAVLQKSVIYKRPDLLTSTATELSPMTMVAVKSEKEDWIEMVTSKKEKSGWVKNNVVSYKDEDVAVAILVAKAMAEKDVAKQKEKLEAILNNPSFAGSVFIEELRNRLYSGQAPTDTATVVEEDYKN